MHPPNPEQLTTFLVDELDDDLRSVIHFAEDTFDLIHVRDDVRERYSDDDLEEVRQDLTFGSLAKPALEDVYVHGDLYCTVRCFENAIEMLFLQSDTEGIAVALEPAAFVAQRSFVGKCLEEAGFESL